MTTVAKLKKWGGSIGVVIPKKMLDSQNLKQGDEVSLDIRPKATLKDLFGIWKGKELDAQKIKDEIREEEKRHDEILSRYIRARRNR
ncbi:AbrB/MazE/SpoVT family DNA-binding domain-containing protein [Candidatus Woesearchaeota archaeon]|nr:AbrB/MazE/SpoVT family DNA-binding domain-containing protein [Candidatus Woesearchaeota archaeon]